MTTTPIKMNNWPVLSWWYTWKHCALCVCTNDTHL